MGLSLRSVAKKIHDVVAAPVGHVIGADIVNPAKSLIAQATHNPIAQAHAEAATFRDARAVGQMAQGFTRPIPEAVTSLVPRQQTYTPGSRIEKTLFGDTPVQNIQKKVINNYQTHPNLPGPQRVGLAGAEAVGSLIQDAPVFGGITRGAKVGMKAAEPGMRAVAANEGGYIAGPKAAGFKQAEKARVTFKGQDNKPRFEQNDKQATVTRLQPGHNDDLGNVLQHPTLYRDYPELATTKVVVTKLKPGVHAVHSPEKNAIYISPETDAKPKVFKSALLHETQHAIQHIENFSKGTNLQAGGAAYHSNLGEMEARTVQERMNMTPEQQAASPLGPPPPELPPGASPPPPPTQPPAPVQGEVLRNGPVSQRKNNSFRDQVGEAIVDKDAVIINQLKDIEKQTGQQGLVQKFLSNSNMQRQAPGIAERDFTHSPHIQNAVSGLSNKNYRNFIDYAAARRELVNAKDGLPTSRPVDELASVVAEHHDQFGANFDALNQYYKRLATKAHEAGLIDKSTLDHYNKDGNYIRLQRDMGDLQQQGRGNRAYHMASTILRQKRTGSTRDVLDPVHTALEHTQKIQGEIQRNTTASHLVGTLHEHGLSRQLINADDVAARRAAFSHMKELKPIKQALKSQVSQASKRAKELSQRNAQLGPQVLERIKGSKPEVQKRAVKLANNAKQAPSRSKRPVIPPTEAHFQEAFQEYLDGNPALVKKMYEFIGNKAEHKRVTRELDALKTKYDAAKRESKHQWLTAKAHADQSTRNKNTVSFLRNGIKETHQVDSQIKRVMDNINPFQLNTLEKVVGAPARLLRAGATALNPVFTASNILKDQLGSAVISSKTSATHAPKNIAAGVGNAGSDFLGGPTSKLYQEYIRRGGNRTQYDLTRNAKKTAEVVNRIRGGRKVGLGQSLLHPIRTLEEANSITEKATRFQNFKGIYEDSVKRGATHEQALEKATMAALEHSVNFSRAGSWGRIINLIVPYSNAAIQGGRTLTNAVKARPFATTTKGFAWVGTPIAAATIWNTSDPERKKVYDNIKPYEKQNNIILIKPGTKVNDVKNDSYDIIKIPLPPDIGNIFQPIRRGIEAARGGKAPNAHEVAADVTKPFVGPLDVSSRGAFVNSILPQAAKPAFNQGANKDFYTGSQVVQDYLADAQTDPTKRVKKNTSSTARIIGEATGIEPVRVDKFASDTAGKIGTFGINASDNALKLAGKSKKNDKGQPIIGGQSVPTAYKRRFGEGAATTDPTNEAQQHFAKVSEFTKGLNKNEMAAYDTIHTTKVDGSKPDKTYYDSALKASVYEKFPKVLAADNKINRGKGEPFYNLPTAQQKVILTLNTLSDDPGNASAKKISKDNPWLQGYYNKQSNYFDKLASSGKLKSTGGNKLATPPNATGTVKTALDTYGSITDSTEKHNYLSSHPEVADFFTATDNYQRQKREALGLPQFDKYPKPSADLQRKLSIYDSLPKGDGKKGGNASRSAFIKANPEISSFFSSVAQYGIIQDSKLAQFEGEELSDKSQGKLSGGGGFAAKGPPEFRSSSSHIVSTRAGSYKKPKVSVRAPSLPRGKARGKGRAKVAMKVTKSRV